MKRESNDSHSDEELLLEKNSSINTLEEEEANEKPPEQPPEQSLNQVTKFIRKFPITPKAVAYILIAFILIMSAIGLIFLIRYTKCRHETGPEYLRLLEKTLPKNTTQYVISETAIFSAGCFWSHQLSYDRIPAVIETAVGYTGGQTSDPTYEEVCTDTTGHAESIKIIFNSNIATYEDLVLVFFERHDPTTLNQQGNDRGTQYRSAIFYLTDEQRNIAQRLKEKTQIRLGKTVVTEITKASKFWDAEEYHQKYLLKHGYSDQKGNTSPVPCYA
jgi:methionine-S-sulfoxide reductase